MLECVDIGNTILRASIAVDVWTRSACVFAQNRAACHLQADTLDIHSRVRSYTLACGWRVACTARMPRDIPTINDDNTWANTYPRLLGTGVAATLHHYPYDGTGTGRHPSTQIYPRHGRHRATPISIYSHSHNWISRYGFAAPSDAVLGMYF